MVHLKMPLQSFGEKELSERSRVDEGKPNYTNAELDGFDTHAGTVLPQFRHALCCLSK